MRISNGRDSTNRCIVCGTGVNRNKAHIQIEYRGKRYLLCCPLCQAEFEKYPEKFIRKAAHSLNSG